MKEFRLKRIMQYTEVHIVQCESWVDAEKLLNSELDFDLQDEGIVMDQSIEFLGDIDE